MTRCSRTSWSTPPRRATEPTAQPVYRPIQGGCARGPASGGLRSGPAFTLAELLIVLAIIVLVAGITLPGIAKIFTSGADAQAYNLISGQLASARAYAIQNRTYAGVHFQLADPDADRRRRDRCYGQIVRPATADDDLDVDDPPDGVADIIVGDFIPAEGFAPEALPYPMVVGQLDDRFLLDVTRDAFDSDKLNTGLELNDFRTCTILFDPSGKFISDLPLVYATAHPLFNSAFPDQYLWEWDVANDDHTSPSGDSYTGEDGARTLVLFDIDAWRKSGESASHLTDYARVLTINAYTGQLMGRY